MPKISERGKEMPASPIRKLAPLSDSAKARGLKVYHLNIGQPDIPTSDIEIEAVKKLDRKILGYSPSNGFLSFREPMGAFYTIARLPIDDADRFCAWCLSDIVLEKALEEYNRLSLVENVQTAFANA